VPKNVKISKRKSFSALIFICLCLFGFRAFCEEPLIEWKTLPDLPRGIFGQLVSVWNGNVIVAGGTNWKDDAKLWVAESYILNADSKAWKKFKKLPWKYAYGAGGCYNGYFIISGGNTTGEKAVYDTFALNLNKAQGKWKRVGRLKEPLIYPGIIQHSSSLYAFGGLTKAEDWKSACSKLRYFNLKPPGNGWKNLEPLPAAGRALSAICLNGKKLYVQGGARLSKTGQLVNLTENWCFDLENKKWERLPDIPVPVRASLALTWKKWIILFACCFTDSDGKVKITDKIYLYDTEKKTWSRYGRAPFSAAVNGIIHNNKMYLTGGEDKAKSRTASCALGMIKIKN
jgi:N-acetylneuraminic acid mutarotase